MKRGTIWFVFGVTLAAGCSSEGDLGKGETAAGDEGSGGSPSFGSEAYLLGFAAGPTGSGAYGGTPAGCEHRLGDFEPVQIWTGYIENYDRGPSDRVAVRFSRLDETGAEGVVLFGDGPWGDAYAVPPSEESVAAGVAFTETDPMTAGFSYTLLEGALDGSRVQFTVGPKEPWCAWCGELPSFRLSSAGPFTHSCAPNDLSGGGDQDGCYVLAQDTGARVDWSCLLTYACPPISGQGCDCDASGCTAFGLLESLGNEYGVEFDVTIESATVVRGSVDGLGTSHGVRFEVERPAAGGAGGSAGGP